MVRKYLIREINEYSKIVLISCVWWYGVSPVMKKILKDYDLSGKDIIVASVNAGWVGHSLEDYKKLLPDSNIKSRLNIIYGSGSTDRDELKTSYSSIDKWINYI